VITIVSVDALRHALAADPSGYTAVDARPRDDFLRGHIPSALSIEWEEWCGAPPPASDPILAQPGYWGTLIEAAPAWYAERLSRCGIASERPMVYADGVRSKGREGRVAWMLLYLGVHDVALLDGGWTGWRAGGGADAVGDVRPRRETFTVALQEERRWTHARMAAAYHERRLPFLVDNRTPSEFAGDCYDYRRARGGCRGRRSSRSPTSSMGRTTIRDGGPTSRGSRCHRGPHRSGEAVAGFDNSRALSA